MYLLRRLTGASGWGRLLFATLLMVALVSPPSALSQTKRPAQSSGASKTPTASKTSTTQAQSSSLGAVSGTITDQQGEVAEGAIVELARDNDSKKQQVASGSNGEYSFANVTPGPFHITVTAPGFDTKTYAGEVQAGQALVIPSIALNITAVTASVDVELTPVEVAEEEVTEEIHQRAFGFIPNFYVTYEANPAPLPTRQKFKLAWKSVSDPVTIIGAGAIAGIYQAADEFPGYGQGAEGYGKRLGASYADVFVGTMVGSAIFPTLLHQDPRYFYRGTGTIRSRLLYAVSNAVICKGDNKKWQPNYSNFLGSFASGGVSYLYYPASDRSLSLVVQNSVVRIAESSLAGIVQEFVLRRFTSVRGGKKQTSTQN
jgi:Carboxypeptidase regulatory-like domain